MTFQRQYGQSGQYGLGLGRHVNHDDRSRAYPIKTTAAPFVSTTWTRQIQVLDQGSLGSCTGNAALGCLGTQPYYNTLREWPTLAGPQWDEGQAISIYSQATLVDPWPGQYPNDDTGSDGLSVAKVLQTNGWISGYRHAFGIDDALDALLHGPVITGVNWYDSMFSPSSEGEVTIGVNSRIAGGHEIVADELDVERNRVWFTNSWSRAWGVFGRFFLRFDTWERLLKEDGDVTVFVPLTKPAPTPEPDPDMQLAAAVRPWCTNRHVGDNRHAALAVQRWLKVKGL
jgi:hypothetical protein